MLNDRLIERNNQKIGVRMANIDEAERKESVPANRALFFFGEF